MTTTTMQNFLADRTNDRPTILLFLLALFASTHLTRHLLHHFDPHARIPPHRTHHFSVLIPFQLLKLTIAILIALTYLPIHLPNLTTTNPRTTKILTTSPSTTTHATLAHRQNLFFFILLGYLLEIITIPTLSPLQLYHHVCILIPLAFWLLLKRDDGLAVNERQLLYAIPTVMVVFGIGGFESAGLVIRVLCAFRGTGSWLGGGSGAGEERGEEREKERSRKRKTRRWVKILWKVAWRALLVQWVLVGCIVVRGFKEVGRVMGVPEAVGCLGLLVVWARTEWVAVMGVGRLAMKFEEVREVEGGRLEEGSGIVVVKGGR